MAQNFEIVDPTGRVSASAAVSRGQLLVVESTGERVVFRREPRYDSADGRLLGFYNANLQQGVAIPGRRARRDASG